MENRDERQKLFFELGLDEHGYPKEGQDLDEIDMEEYTEKLRRARILERQQREEVE